MTDDRSSWREELGALAGAFGWHAREAARSVRRVFDGAPYHVVGYRGYATASRALVLGRVLQDEGIVTPAAPQSRWRNLLDSIKRIESDPLPFACVRASLGGASRELVADDEGFVRDWLPMPAPLAPGGWHEVELELRDAPARVPRASARTVARVLAPSADAGFGVISDMDDTVLQSEVTSFLRAARLMLLENALTRLPFPGVAAFYRALQEGPRGGAGNPIFYVSSSPWNLYDLIAGFLDAQTIPAGPLLLRDWDLGPSLARSGPHKTALIREILDAYPSLPFILVGDSGQEDPEIYSAIVRDHPGRILAVYIRNVTPRPERLDAIRRLADEVRASGSTLVLADDTLAAARHAAAHGWVAEESLGDVGEAKRDDAGETGAKIHAPGVPSRTDAPTLVVDPDLGRRDIE